MTEWLSLIVSILGVFVSIWVAWSASRSARGRHRGEEAKLAFEIATQLREWVPGTADARQTANEQALKTQQSLAKKVEESAMFASSEFARLTLRDGWSWSLILTLALYGVILTILGFTGLAASTTPTNSAALFITFGVACLTTGLLALYVKDRRRERLRDAGLNAPSLHESLRSANRRFQEAGQWLRARKLDRQRRKTLQAYLDNEDTRDA